MLPPSGTVLESPERVIKIPTTTENWEEVVATISRIEGVEYQILRYPNSEALDATKRYIEEGNAEEELVWSMRQLLGDPAREGVPGPWDHDKFPGITPESLEVCLKRVLTHS